jgi:single-strand DNA-binding protein
MSRTNVSRARQEKVEPAPEDDANVVSLSGRLSAPVQSRTLPSGDELVSFRVIVRRLEGGVDTLDCVAFRADVRRRAQSWGSGDRLEIDGVLRRRFWRGSAGPVSRTEVEVRTARRVAKAR